MPLLQVENLNVRYGSIQGTNDISFEVNEGETVALIGSNGAGKSSTLKAILGIASYPSGSITYKGQQLKGLKPHEVLRLGVGYSPEGRRVFPALSVADNLRVGAYTRTSQEFEQRSDQIYGYFPRLKERYKQDAGSLSGGDWQP